MPEGAGDAGATGQHQETDRGLVQEGHDTTLVFVVAGEDERRALCDFTRDTEETSAVETASPRV
jgi:hypothetical protein